MDLTLRDTPLLDYRHPDLDALVAARGWRELAPHDRIGAIYRFVRDEIAFGYNAADDLPASSVLADGYGQCNTKTTLLMALLRAAGVPCRFHGAAIRKELQRGVVEGLAYRLAPAEIIHSWAEVLVDGRWIELEGVILDAAYLDGLRACVAPSGPLLGYGAGTEAIDAPAVEWTGDDTAIQKTGLARDFGAFDDPDAFYRARGANLGGLRGLVYRLVVRRRMNRRVEALRAGRGG